MDYPERFAREPNFKENGIEVFEDALSPHLFEQFRDRLRQRKFLPFPLDRPQVLYLAPVPELEDYHLTRLAEIVVQRDLEQVRSFARLNTETLDTSFRVHADGKIYGAYPDVACVFFIDTRDDSGTAFYESAVHGRTPKDDSLNVFKDDDGTWRPYVKVTQKENSMLVYNARLYHGRFPWKSYGTDPTSGRIVVVKFLKYKR